MSLMLSIRRTGWDVVFGILLLLAGVFILGDVAFFSFVSVMFVGWMATAAGVAALIAALIRVREPEFWPAVVSGALLTSLGLMFLRNPGAALVTLTLLAGIVFLASGIARIVSAIGQDEGRPLLLLGGVVSAVLGLIVLSNVVDASLTMVGVFLGIQTMVDGAVLLLVGRVHATDISASPGMRHAALHR